MEARILIEDAAMPRLGVERRDPPRPYPYFGGNCPRCKTGVLCKEYDGTAFHEINCISCARTLADWHPGRSTWRVLYDPQGNPISTPPQTERTE